MTSGMGGGLGVRQTADSLGLHCCLHEVGLATVHFDFPLFAKQAVIPKFNRSYRGDR